MHGVGANQGDITQRTVEDLLVLGQPFKHDHTQASRSNSITSQQSRPPPPRRLRLACSGCDRAADRTGSSEVAGTKLAGTVLWAGKERHRPFSNQSPRPPIHHSATNSVAGRGLPGRQRRRPLPRASRQPPHPVGAAPATKSLRSCRRTQGATLWATVTQ